MIDIDRLVGFIIIIAVSVFILRGLLNYLWRRGADTYRDLMMEKYRQGFKQSAGLDFNLSTFRDLHHAHDILKEEMEFCSKLALATLKHRWAQYDYMKDKIAQISPDEMFDKWIPLWVDHMVEWHKNRKRDRWMIEVPHMSLEEFIAMQITDNWFIGYESVTRRFVGPWR